MGSVSSVDILNSRIEELELLQQEQMTGLKKSAVSLIESISPAQVLKTIMRDILVSGDVRGNVIDATLGIGAGLLGKKIFASQSKNIFKKIAGSALQIFLTNFVSKKMHQSRQPVTENGAKTSR